MIMSERPLDYASNSTPLRSPALHCLLSMCLVLLGGAVLLAVPLAMILASILLLMELWLAAVLTMASIPGVIVGGLKLNAAILRAQDNVSG